MHGDGKNGLVALVVVCACLAASCGAAKGSPSGWDALTDVADGWDASESLDAWDSWEGLPDGYVHQDADGDTIDDIHEGSGDTDGDTIIDREDLDSDADGIPDADEAGDEDLATPPIDTDGDFVPDFRDPDSDGDGISDADELTAGTDPYDPDSDGDGATDLVEIVAETDPNDSMDNPHSRGDFVFLVPYGDDPSPDVDTLVFGTNIQMADVYFMIDRSASMNNEILNLRTSLSTTIVPAVDAAIPDVWFGVGQLDQCPNAAGCTSSGTAIFIQNLANVDGDPAVTQAALDAMSGTCTGAKEPYVAALWLIANGDPSVWAWPASKVAGRTCADPATTGWPCFRPGAVPIVVMFGDESFYTQSYGAGCDPSTGAAPSFDQAVAEMNAIHARFIGINSGNTLAGFTDVCTATGSVDTTGSPLAFTIPGDGTGLGDQVIDAIEMLASQVPLDIFADAVDVDEGPSDSVDATIFIDRIVPNTVGGVVDPADPTRVCVGGLHVEDTAGGDTVPDVFVDVLPGTVVCFDIYPAKNVTVEPEPMPLLFLAQVRVIGEGITVLDTRDVWFLVPPDVSIGGPD